jgi:hypothetical protein
MVSLSFSNIYVCSGRNVVLEEVSIDEHCSLAFLCNSDHAVDMLELLKDADRKGGLWCIGLDTIVG